MKHLGGFGFDKRMFELSVVDGSNPWDIHLWMATQEQRDQSFLQVKMLPVQPLDIWTMSGLNKLCGLSPTRQVGVEVCSWNASG